MSLVAQKKVGFAVFRLFGIVYGLFQPVLSRYSMFWIILLFTSDDLPQKLIYIFTINQRHVRFYYKVGQALLQTVTPWVYCKVAQLLLKHVVDFFYYKVGQVVL